MARVVTNISGGILVLPSRRELAAGASIELDKDEDGHPVVNAWLGGGMLLDVAADAKARTADAKAIVADAKAADEPGAN